MDIPRKIALVNKYPMMDQDKEKLVFLLANKGNIWRIINSIIEIEIAIIINKKIVGIVCERKGINLNIEKKEIRQPVRKE